jgi:hypothetical protein
MHKHGATCCHAVLLTPHVMPQPGVTWQMSPAWIFPENSLAPCWLHRAHTSLMRCHAISELT